MDSAIKLAPAAVRNCLPQLRAHLGTGDQQRLDATLNLFGSARELTLGRVLRKLFPEKRVEDQLTAFRLFRSRLSAASDRAGLRLRLTVDDRKRSLPEDRQCWFEGESLSKAQIRQLTLASFTVRAGQPMAAV